MSVKSQIASLSVLMLIGIGLIPLFYFATLELSSVHAANGDMTGITEPEDPLDRYVENNAFGVGEKLTFDINYGFINAGTATMEVVQVVEYEDRPCFQIVTRALSNSFFSTFYGVDDRVESIVDAVGLFSWRFEKRLREGSYEADRLCEVDQRKHLAFYKNDTVVVPPFVQDALSALYYTRAQQLEIGKSVFVDNFTDGKLYPLEVKVHKKERITVEAGTFDCIVVEPLMKTVGVFKHSGKLTVWLTDDELKMPVLMKSKVLVGSISAELTDFELGELEVF